MKKVEIITSTSPEALQSDINLFLEKLATKDLTLSGPIQFFVTNIPGNDYYGVSPETNYTVFITYNIYTNCDE